MVFGSTFGGSALALSSSDMPFLKALMPWAMSPISSEILPRPNSNRTTTTTTIQCQMLKPPIRKPSARAARGRARSCLRGNLGFGRGKNKDFGRIDLDADLVFGSNRNGFPRASFEQAIDAVNPNFEHFHHAEKTAPLDPPGNT